jgi:hypothetical protein
MFMDCELIHFGKQPSIIYSTPWLRHPIRHLFPPAQIMGVFLVCGGVGGTAEGFIEHEVGGIIAGLQDIEAQITGFPYRGLMVGPRRRNEIIDVPGFDMDVDQRDMHGGFLELY